MAQSEEKNSKLPTIPVGLDAYRMWDQWPLQRIGVRAYMRSTYDRSGGNEWADASHYLFAREEDHNVSLDVKGKGMLYFFRANHWHGSPWHFIVDGNDYVVKESGTDDPVNAKRTIRKSTFIPSKPFPEPLNWTWGTTNGANLIWTPMPFNESFRIAYSRTFYGTGYYIYNLFANENQLSQPLKSWNIKQEPDKDVLDLIHKAGTDIAPKGIATKTGEVVLDKETVTLAKINKPSSVVRAFKMKIPIEQSLDLDRVFLKVTWDKNKHPSINAPLSMFFGAGTFYNREEKEYLVKGFPVNIRYDYEKGELEASCYYPMPFFKSAKFELTGIRPGKTKVAYEIRYEPLKIDKQLSSYFHATYTDIPNPELGKDMVYLDTKGIEGQQDWSGSFVGTSFVFSHNGFLPTLEGDPRFFFDDSQTPQAYGTGTEEWGGGGDYWGGKNMTLPFAGHPCGTTKKENAKHEKDLIESAYRFLLADMMPFGKRAVIRFEHGGENLSTEHYEAVAYWYGLPKPSLVLTDSIDVGNPENERLHAYESPDASAVQTIVSRYEWGVDKLPTKVAKEWGSGHKLPENYDELKGKEIFPAQEKDGRYTRGVSTFIVDVSKDNVGVLLRRTLDYSFPNQTANVFVLDESNGQHEWKKAGIWYLAGSNTCIYSAPKGELGKRQKVVQTSNRRLRDDEFMIPATLTSGKSKLKIKVEFVANDQGLFLDMPFPKESAWSELDYKVYSYVLPEF
ncbi:DUF2961 domain-containing protein [Fulvivirgaceae bacterium BMA10]|uniref:DUF2961 domain-containing protein n=1 Tax=Splendidivirga corallicola TaxID=3051826 RepID=A0ABT8KTZ5_9BACT|nr:DUF2961 domain-containing protein [Fulvivirgaceae bacterium BMA10]